MSNERCETCRFWEEMPRDDIGWCHRYPPVVLAGQMLRGRYATGGDDQEVAVHPVVFFDNWCGEHQPKPQPEPETNP